MEADRSAPAVGDDAGHQHALDPSHHLDVGRAELLVCRGPRIRRAHRRRKRGWRYGDVRARRPGRGGRRAGSADRRGPSARHDGGVVIVMTAVIADGSSTADLGLSGPVPARTTGPSGADRSLATGRAVRSWPLLVLA